MKYSIQRKSHQFRINNDFTRKTKKYKTYTKQSLLLHKTSKNKHLYSQPVVSSVLSQLIDQAYTIIWNKHKKQALNQVAQQSVILGDKTIQLNLISPTDPISFMKSDHQPRNIQCDNLCGTDQFGKHNLEKLSKIDLRSTYHAKSVPKSSNQYKRSFNMSSNLLSTHKRNENNQLQSHDVSFASTANIDNNLQLRKNLFHLKDRSKTSQKLIPLFKSEKQDNSQVKIEQFFRDRLLKQISNKKISIKLKQMNQISHLSSFAAKTVDQFNFDYNGNKISLLKGRNSKSYNNILKTVYKINKQKNQIKQHNIRSSIKYRPSLNLDDTSSFPFREKVLPLMKVSNIQTEDIYNVKSTLQSQFKKRKINYKLLNVQ